MKSKIFKLIFILSFIPYVYILYSILFGKYVVNGVELYGIERLLKNVVSNFQYFVYTGVPIIPICLTFQMCYIFRKQTKIMFMCSFIPYLFVLLLGLQYAFFGGRFLGETVYFGLEGFVIGVMGCFAYYISRFPIIPICLIFQIGYIIIKLIKKYLLKNKKML